jgi:hypothetical protein
VKEEGLAEALVFDRYRRCGSQEWLLPMGTTVEEFASGAVTPILTPDDRLDVEIHTGERDEISVDLRGVGSGLAISKRISVPLSGEEVAVSYGCDDEDGRESRTALLVSEWNLSPPQSPAGDDRMGMIEVNGRTIDIVSPGAVDGVREFVVRGSAAFGLRCKIVAGDAGIWYFPVESVSSSEGGVERVLQGFSISIVGAIELPTGATFGIEWGVEA